MSCADTLASILVERIRPLIPLGKRETLARKGKNEATPCVKGVAKRIEELLDHWH